MAYVTQNTLAISVDSFLSGDEIDELKRGMRLLTQLAVAS